MDVVTVLINAAVMGAVGILVAWFLKGRIDGLDHRIDRLEHRLDGRMDSVQTSIDGLRSDLTQVALAVGVRPRATNR